MITRSKNRILQLRNLVRLKRHELDTAGRILSNAFLDDPLYKYVLPDDGERRSRLFWLMKKVAAYCLLFGEAHVTPGGEGIACWLPPGETEMTIIRIIRVGLPAIIWRFGLNAFTRLDDNMTFAARMHKKIMQEDHWYLLAIGVDPPHWGKGIGSLLMQPVLDAAGSAGLACYLETHNERNVAFYEKHGFWVAQEGENPKHNVRVWAMKND